LLHRKSPLSNDPERGQNTRKNDERDNTAPEALSRQSNDDGDNQASRACPGVDVLFSPHRSRPLRPNGMRLSRAAEGGVGLRRVLAAKP